MDAPSLPAADDVYPCIYLLFLFPALPKLIFFHYQDTSVLLPCVPD